MAHRLYEVRGVGLPVRLTWPSLGCGRRMQVQSNSTVAAVSWAWILRGEALTVQPAATTADGLAALAAGWVAVPDEAGAVELQVQGPPGSAALVIYDDGCGC